MNITTEEILNYIRCTEWDDERTRRFMNTQPYVVEGTKSIEDFLNSIGVEGITEEEVFWILLQKLSIDSRFDFCIDYISILFYSELDKFDLEFQTLFKGYLNQTEITDQFLADTKSDELNIIESEDYCDKSRLLHYLHNVHYEYLYKKSDLLELVRSIFYNMNTMYNKNISYTLNYLHSLIY